MSLIPSVLSATRPRDPAAGDEAVEAANSYRLRHEPALDGLRGVAVVLVLLFHAGVSGFSGGYLGVSIFFVLSGFLIGSLLLREREESSTVGLGHFYARRLRRLLPAQVACWVLVVGLSAWMFGYPRIAPGRELFWAGSQAWNWREIASSTSYASAFQNPAGASPFTHLWSLAVEEQIYLVLPLLILVFGRRIARLSWSWLAALTVAFATMPLASRQFVSANALYLGTPFRACEVGIGLVAAVAVRRVRPGRIARHVGLIAAIVAAVLIGVAGSSEDAWPYRGWLGVFGGLVALVVVGCLASGVVRSVLSLRVLGEVGVISYGLYLYHWPIFLALRPDTIGLSGAGLVTLRLGATVAIAAASYFVVEQPIRRGRIAPRPALIGGCAAVVTIAAIASFIPAAQRTVTDAGSIDRAHAAAVAITFRPDPPTTAAGPGAAPIVAADIAATSPATGPVATTTVTPVDSAPSVLLIGDSTAAAIGAGGVEALAGGALTGAMSVDASGACGILRGGHLQLDVLDAALQMNCPPLIWDQALHDVANLHPDVVAVMITLADTWPRTFDDGATWTNVASDDGYERLSNDYHDYFSRLRADGARCVVWITGPTAYITDDTGTRQPEGSYVNGDQHAVRTLVAGLTTAHLIDAEIDLGAWYDTEPANDTENRPDGIHPTVDASRTIVTTWLWNQLTTAQQHCAANRPPLG